MGQVTRRTVRDLRRGTRSTLLRTLYFHGPVSRQELAARTGLSSGSVSNVVGELLADDLLEEAGSVGSDGGRPRTLLRVAPGRGYLVGVDVGETRVRVELFDLSLTELARSEYPLVSGPYAVEPVVRHILACLAAVVADSGVHPGGIVGVGVGVPGIVERGSEAVVHGQAIGWDGVPLERLLRRGTDLPLFIDNGATAQGQAEMWFGAGRGVTNAVIALLGSGVGASIVNRGTPYRGATSGAGEWGHTVVRVGGRRCRCGAVGCLEAYVGAQAVLARAGRAAEGVAGAAAGRDTDGAAGAVAGRDAGVGIPATAARAAEAAGPLAEAAAARPAAGGHAGQEAALAALVAAADTDPVARKVLQETAAYLGAGIADLINLFNPERIILGGWAGLLLGARILPAVRESAASYALRRPFAQTDIALCRLGPDAVALGAATLPLAHFLSTGGAGPAVR
jgi:predicted NBD/HSP70 family sugar kinase